MPDENAPPPRDVLKPYVPLVGRRHFVIGAVLAGAVGLTQLRMPKPVVGRVSKKTFESWVPNKVGNWTFVTASGVVLPPPDALSDRLYDQLITRVYQADDEPPVMVAIAYNNAQNGVVQLHRPEICYPAGGYDLTPTMATSIQTLERRVPANIFTAVGTNRTEQVLYWTRIGPDFPLSWADQRISVMKANLAGYIPDGILVRFSLVGNDQGQAKGILEKFVQQFEAGSAKPLRKVMVG